MRTLDTVALLAADTVRARAYVDVLAGRGLAFAQAFLLPGTAGPRAAQAPAPAELFDNVTSLADALERIGVPRQMLPESDINSETNCRLIAPSAATTLVLAAPAGMIVRAPLFRTGKKILHVHPGWLPEYRGSTTIYYSLLAERSVAATALYLDDGIDTGPVLERKRFPPPRAKTSIDVEYDPWLRADLLADVLVKVANGDAPVEQPQSDRAGSTFYIVHPVLKHLAILGKT